MKNYPIWQYHEEKQPDGLIVYSAEQMEKLGEGWVDSTSMFKKSQEPNEESNPDEAALALETPAVQETKKSRTRKGAKE